jgi:glycosyltransferase involved in cell wall biosynthesis
MLLGNNPYPHDPRVLKEASTLTAAGYHVTVVCPHRPGWPRDETLDGVVVRRFRPAPEPASLTGHVLDVAWVTVACLALAIRIAISQGFEAVHVHNPPDTLALVAALFKATGRPVVFDHHDLAPELYAANSLGGGRAVVRRALEALERLSCRISDRVVTTNGSHRDVLITRCGVDPARITIVRNGPDPQRLRLEESVHPDDGRPYTIGWLGAMSRHDGIDDLLLAVRHLIRDHGMPDVRCVLLGDGSALEESRSLTRELGLDGHVEFPGFVPYDELPGWLSNVDVCAVPDPSNSYNDRCTMLKVMDYMALERPVVAYDLPETRVTAGDAALYVPASDVRAFAAALALLAQDPERRRAMGREGRRRVEQRFAWAYSVPPLLGVYGELLGGRGK